MPNATYLCIECEETLPITDFYTDNSKRGHTKRCKKCFDLFTVFKSDDKKLHCNWCLSYGLFAFDGRPLGIHEVKHNFPAIDCPNCGANYKKKKRSVVDPNNNPHYPW